MWGVGKRKEQRRVLGIGDDGIYADAWGRQKVTHDHSVFSAIFSQRSALKRWIEYNDGVEQLTKNNVQIVDGELVVSSNGVSTFLMSARNPKYQGNRGHLYSNSVIIKNATPDSGKLYAVIRTFRNSTVEELRRTEITFDDNGTAPIDLSCGNTFDIQSQLRDVGNSKFYINQREFHLEEMLGKLKTLVLSNMSIPLSFECRPDGIVRFGIFTPQCGIFYEWVFNTPQETELISGCVDLSSEGGKDQRQELLVATSNELSGTDAYTLAVRIPETVDGAINSVDAEVTRIRITVDKKANLIVYRTRDPNLLTYNGTNPPLETDWEDINGGNVQVLKPTTSTQLTYDNTSTNSAVFTTIPAVANLINQVDKPNETRLDLFLVHGEILICRVIGNTVTSQASILLGNEI